jgi:soluble lytic murein transglycosylase
MDKKARELLVNVQRNQTFPKLWWRERSRQIRSALGTGEYNEAYKLASGHIQTNHYTKAEADWTAGWIALRYAKKPIEAARYFTVMYDRVKTPLSKSRAAYWAGRAFQAAFKTGVSNSWYNLASNYQTTFYGQLAKNSLLFEPSNSPSPPISKTQYDDGIDINFYMETITALHSINKKKLARKFLKALALSNISKENFIRVATLANQIGYRDMSVYIARKAARKGIFLMDLGYPIIKLPYKSVVEPALILSVIRQESNFDEKAKSRRGAMGYMQLMPQTAEEIGKILKINFTLDQLQENPTLNIILGSEYLRRLIEKFDGSYVLALAAYNAGPLNVKRWMKNAGDPRTIEVDVIDWVERIPFRETRNYVQRVLENVTVYRRLHKTHVKKTARPESYWRPLGQHMSP